MCEMHESFNEIYKSSDIFPSKNLLLKVTKKLYIKCTAKIMPLKLHYSGRNIPQNHDMRQSFNELHIFQVKIYCQKFIKHGNSNGQQQIKNKKNGKNIPQNCDRYGMCYEIYKSSDIFPSKFYCVKGN